MARKITADSKHVERWIASQTDADRPEHAEQHPAELFQDFNAVDDGVDGPLVDLWRWGLLEAERPAEADETQFNLTEFARELHETGDLHDLYLVAMNRETVTFEVPAIDELVEPCRNLREPTA